MKLLATLLVFFVSPILYAQTRADSLQLIRNTVSLYDLDFTEAEADSMIGNLRYYQQLYKGMHKTLPWAMIFPTLLHFIRHRLV